MKRILSIIFLAVICVSVPVFSMQRRPSGDGGQQLSEFVRNTPAHRQKQDAAKGRIKRKTIELLCMSSPFVALTTVLCWGWQKTFSDHAMCPSPELLRQGHTMLFNDTASQCVDCCGRTCAMATCLLCAVGTCTVCDDGPCSTAFCNYFGECATDCKTICCPWKE